MPSFSTLFTTGAIMMTLPIWANDGKARPDPEISKTVLLQPSAPNVAVLSTFTTYTSSEGSNLFQEYSELVAMDTFGRYFTRTSRDNGATWSDAQLSYEPKETPEGVIRRGEVALLYDKTKKRLIRFYNQHLYPGGTHTKDVIKYIKIVYQISDDEGRTFSDPQQLIINGFNTINWAPGIEYGKNSMGISFTSPFIDSKGRIILPALEYLDREDIESVYRVPLAASCLIGTWTESDSISWEVGEKVKGDPLLSPRGIYEPAVAELTDGRFLMVARGSNITLPDKPSRKWKAISLDGGNTWSETTPFAYDDGSLFYSPSTGSQLIRSSRNGKLYWVGNITPENPYGNFPRYPLVIAQVNETNTCLIKDSVRIIDTKLPEDSDTVQLTNFRMYEDRTTGEFVVTLARLKSKSEEDLFAPAYQYRILPK